MEKAVPQVQRHRSGAGYSVPHAAEIIGVSPKMLRSAIEMKQVRTIPFGKIERIPKSEVERLKEQFK